MWITKNHVGNGPDQDPIPDKILRMAYGFWTFPFVLSLLNLTENPVEPVKMLLAALLAALTAVVLTISGLAGRQRRRPTGLILLLTGWIAWQGVSALASSHVTNSLHALYAPIIWAILAVGAAHIYRQPRAAGRFLMLFLLAVTLSSLYGCLQKMGYDPFPWAVTTTEEYRAVPATFGHPNFAGHTLAPTLFIAALLASRKNTRWALIPLLLMGLHLYWTHMRGGLLAVFCAIAFLLLWGGLGHITTKPIQRLLAVTATSFIAVAIVIIIALCWLPSHLSYNPINRDTSLALRCNSAINATNMFAEQPFFGAGPGNYELEAPRYWTPMEQEWYALSRLKNDHVHCEPLEAGAELGVFGIFFHYALLGWLFLRGVQLAEKGYGDDARRLGILFMACAVVFGVDGLFGFNLHVPVSSALFFLLLGMAEGLWRHRPDAPTPATAHGFPAGWIGATLLAGICLWISIAGILAGMALQTGNSALKAMSSYKLSAGDRWTIQAQLTGAARYAPWDIRLFERMGQIAIFSLDNHTIADAFSEALRRNANHPTYWALRGEAFFHLAEEAADAQDSAGARLWLRYAESDIDTAARLCPSLPSHFDMKYRIAALHSDLDKENNLDDAIHIRQCALAAREALQAGVSDKASAWCALARMASRQNQHADAADYLSRALSSNPTHPEIWSLANQVIQNGYGMLLLDALINVRAIMANPAAPYPDIVCKAGDLLAALLPEDSENALSGREFIRDTLRKFPQALAAWAIYTRWTPSGATPTFLRTEADFLTASGVSAEEFPPLIRAIIADPLAPADVADAAEVLALSVDDGIKEVADAAALSARLWTPPLLRQIAADTSDPTAGRLYLAAGRIYLAAGRWTDADNLLAEADAQSHTEEITVLLAALRSEALAHLDKPEEALEKARQAAEKAPENPTALLMYARRLKESGRLEAAKEHYLGALAHMPRGTALYACAGGEYTTLMETRTPSGKSAL